MNNKHFLLIWALAGFVILVFSATAVAQIETVGCFTSWHELIKPGHSWDEDYNGVKYRCTCNGDGTTSCVKKSSSSSSTSNNNSSGGNNLNGQIMQSVVAPLMQNFFNWLFSPSDDQQQESSAEDQAKIKAQNEEYERLAAEYKAKVKEQVDNLSNEYNDSMKEKFEDQKKSTVNDIKNKVAQSESVKLIKQLNCSAFQSLEAAKMISSGDIDFKDLNGDLENSSKLADLTAGKKSGCPEIKYNVREVTAVNPVGFQQVFYETIKQKADSITVSVALLKVKDDKIKSDIGEKEKAVDQLKTNPPKNGDDDQLMKDALKSLNDAVEEEKKVNEELTKDQKNIEQIEQVRSVYDIKKPE